MMLKEPIEWCGEAVEAFLKKWPTVKLTNKQKIDLIVILSEYAEIQEDLNTEYVSKDTKRRTYQDIRKLLKKAERGGVN